MKYTAKVYLEKYKYCIGHREKNLFDFPLFGMTQGKWIGRTEKYQQFRGDEILLNRHGGLVLDDEAVFVPRTTLRDDMIADAFDKDPGLGLKVYATLHEYDENFP